MLDIFLIAPGLIIAAFFGATIQRIAGMGFGISVSGFALANFDPFTAVYVSAVIGFGVTVVTTVQLWRHIVWPVIWPIFAPIMLSMFFGFGLAYLYGEAPLIRALFQALGIFAILAALRAYVIQTKTSTNPLIARPWVGGSITGFLSGTIGMPGPTIAPYFAARNIVGLAFVATITPVFIFTSLSRFSLGMGNGFDERVLSIAVLGAVIATVGVYVGSFIAPHVPINMQRRIIIALIIASGGRLLLALVTGLWAYFTG